MVNKRLIALVAAGGMALGIAVAGIGTTVLDTTNASDNQVVTTTTTTTAAPATTTTMPPMAIGAQRPTTTITTIAAGDTNTPLDARVTHLEQNVNQLDETAITRSSTTTSALPTTTTTTVPGRTYCPPANPTC